MSLRCFSPLALALLLAAMPKSSDVRRNEIDLQEAIRTILSLVLLARWHSLYVDRNKKKKSERNRSNNLSCIRRGFMTVLSLPFEICPNIYGWIRQS